MDGRSRPYFFGVDQILNSQQKEALVQGIRHVLETTPDDFESFEFRFTGYQLYIYKLDQGVVMLVLTSHDLVYTDYLDKVDKLKLSLEEDILRSVANFRLLASEITLPSQNVRKYTTEENLQEKLKTSVTFLPNVSPATVSQNGHNSNITLEPANYSPNHNNHANSLPETKQSPSTPLSVVQPPPEIQPEVEDHPLEPVAEPVDPTQDVIRTTEVIASMNALSNLTSHYLGTAVIANYWKSSRPKDTQGPNFEIDRAGQINVSQLFESEINQPIDPDQLSGLRKWVHAFIDRCSKVIRDFPTLIQQAELSDRQKFILFG